MDLIKDIKSWFQGSPFGEKRAVSDWNGQLNSVDDWQGTFFGNSGGITRENAMMLPVYYSAVRLISESLAGLPFKAYRSTSTGKEPLTDDHRYKLLKNPNELQTRFNFIQCLVMDVLTVGNCYAIIHRAGRRVLSLEYVPAGRVAVQVEDGKVRYKIREKEYKPEDIIHVKGMGFDGIKGFAPIDYAKDTVGLGMAAAKFGKDYFEKGAVLSGVLVSEGNLTNDQQKQIHDNWHSKAHGKDNNHSTKVIGGGLKYSKIGNTPLESQNIETRMFQIQEVARLFGIPLHLLQDLTKSSFSNIEIQSFEYTKHCLYPWCIRFEQEFTRRLFPEDDLFCEFSIDGLLRASAKDRADLYKTLFEIGAITQNQVAKLENLEGRPEGDRTFIHKDLIPTDKIDEYLNNQNGNTKSPAQ